MIRQFNENFVVSKKSSKLYYYALTPSDIQNTSIPKWQYNFSTNVTQPTPFKTFITTQEKEKKSYSEYILHRILI